MVRWSGPVGRKVAKHVCYLRNRRRSGWPSHTVPCQSRIAKAYGVRHYPLPWAGCRTKPLRDNQLPVRVPNTIVSLTEECR